MVSLLLGRAALAAGPDVKKKKKKAEGGTEGREGAREECKL